MLVKEELGKTYHSISIAQSAGAEEYSDCTSAEE